jgi:hypothetical protein
MYFINVVERCAGESREKRTSKNGNGLTYPFNAYTPDQGFFLPIQSSPAQYSPTLPIQHDPNSARRPGE